EALNLKTEQYEGPLDLLLALISKHKINIFDIPIHEICEQYMQYIDGMRILNM
ncbi:MAG TPA: segregation/condensation protein A, partial [Clostridiales bacterium]|nr:segregation/condensation protein A [Clostridiales bacterium]